MFRWRTKSYHDKRRNNWSTPARFGRGPGSDVVEKNFGEDKTSDLSSPLFFASHSI